MNPLEILDVLESKGAVQTGHFRLSSGRHSDLFVQKFRVLEHPRLTQRFGESISALFDGDFDAVASPALGAVVLGFAVGLAAEKRVLFAERVDGEMEFRRGFQLRPRERVLVVEDVVTTGGSAKEVVNLVRYSGADPIGVGALLDRSEETQLLHLGAPLRALVKLDARSWEPPDCPLCRDELPLDDPGSRRLR